MNVMNIFHVLVLTDAINMLRQMLMWRLEQNGTVTLVLTTLECSYIYLLMDFVLISKFIPNPQKLT
jgi:hypothetical protein